MVTAEELDLIIKYYIRFMIEPVYKSRRVVDNRYHNCEFESNFGPLYCCMDPFNAKIDFYFVEYFIGSSEEASRQKIASIKITDIESWYLYYCQPVLEQLEENLKQGR